MKITDKMRLAHIIKGAKITRLYRGHGARKMFDTCAWRIIIRCQGDWHHPRSAIDAAILAAKKPKRKGAGRNG